MHYGTIPKLNTPKPVNHSGTVLIAHSSPLWERNRSWRQGAKILLFTGIKELVLIFWGGHPLLSQNKLIPNFSAFIRSLIWHLQLLPGTKYSVPAETWVTCRSPLHYWRNFHRYWHQRLEAPALHWDAVRRISESWLVGQEALASDHRALSYNRALEPTGCESIETTLRAMMLL